MLAPYRSILRLPGALAFSAVGLLARLEMAMVSLGSVLLVQRVTGSYAVGGAVAATYGVSSALVSPWVARLTDRFGQARLLRAAALPHGATLIGIVAFAVLPAPRPWLFVAAALAGVTQASVGSLVRARWARLVGGTHDLQVAFALESVLDEVVFIVGPIAVTLIAALLHPAVGLLLAAATAVGGAYLLAAQRSTEPPVGPPPEQGGGAARTGLVTRGLFVLLLVFLTAGGIFGAAEVTVAAVTKAAGVPAAAGVILAVWAAGSLLGGLIYGAVRWRSRLHRRFLTVVVLLALLTLPMVLVTSVPLLALVFFVAGFAIGPVITTGFMLVESLVSAERLTEGLAWTNTALLLTYAVSAAVAGAAIDAFGPHAGFVVPVTAALLCVVAVMVGLPWLRPGRRRHASGADPQGQPSVS